MALFERGEIVSVKEAMLIGDVSRQAVSGWLRAARIDIAAKRLERVARLRTQAQRIAEGRMAPRRPSKEQMRKTIADAMANTVKKSRRKTGWSSSTAM